MQRKDGSHPFCPERFPRHPARSLRNLPPSMTTFKYKKCKKELKSKRNLKEHEGRHICRERRAPRLRAARLEQAKQRARQLDAARKHTKYVPKLPQCNFCERSVKAWVVSASCGYKMHHACFDKMRDTYHERDPVFGRRECDPRCPYCRHPFTPTCAV